jgi:hypothetical protein
MLDNKKCKETEFEKSKKKIVDPPQVGFFKKIVEIIQEIEKKAIEKNTNNYLI